MSQPKWLKQSVIEVIHAMQIGEHGGLPGIRDQGLLNSALARPKNLYQYQEADLFQIAACYAHSLVSNHPFADGNKRTALLATYTFLHINGIHLTASEADATIKVTALAAGDIYEQEFADWIKQNTVPEKH